MKAAVHIPGISWVYHDSAAALIKDGDIFAAAHFSRSHIARRPYRVHRRNRCGILYLRHFRI